MTTVFTHRIIQQQISKLYATGGQSQLAAEKCKALLWDLKNTNNPSDVLSRIPITNNGESRIKHCIKYSLPGFCRLVTIQDKGWVVLLYLGTHDQVEKWLNANKGLSVAITDPTKGLFDILISEDINNPETRINPDSDYSSSFLFEKLKHYWDFLSEGLPLFIIKSLQKLDTTSNDEDIFEIATAINNLEKQDLIFDVFMALRGGLVDEAKNRILAFQSDAKLISELSNADIKSITSNDHFLNLDELDAADMQILMSNKNWLEWMLFMHPAQKNVVDKDFSGSARLLGVSGSGKTCVVVRRAIRLAKKYNGEKILILTLNESLSKLIERLVDMMLESNGEIALKPNIIVKSFWQLCKELLIVHSKETLNKILTPRTHIHLDSIDDVWEEFYKCENNNDDAEILFSFHQMLLSRGIFPQDYIKQEFDWIRSFLPKRDRKEYIKVPRENRAIQFLESERDKILIGLNGWEDKMTAVGGIDYLGLTNTLYQYIDQINSEFRCVLVDEMQDFGTLELSIIRKLVDSNENDLFLCGDIAQQVYYKHHQIKNAGINIPPNSYLKLYKNYRNSREILTASHELFINNVDQLKYKSDELELLNPEFANFSSPKPFLRKGNSFDDEIFSAIDYLNENLTDLEKGCIAICNYSIFQVENLAINKNLACLNWDIKELNDKIYLSDLEQTKGFEFDRMVILNLSNSVFPNQMLPEEETYREISKLYVAMTRAKKELILSYSISYSIIFNKCIDSFTIDNWKDHCNYPNTNNKQEVLNHSDDRTNVDLKIIGKKFLYHRLAVGMSKELQNKLIEHVGGKSITQSNKKIGWITMNDLLFDIKSNRYKPHLTRIFGNNAYNELIKIFNSTV